MIMNEEEYLLQCLSEECAEVQQRVSKALRFGLEEIQVSNPNETRNNRQRINYELNDLRALISRLEHLHKDYTLDNIPDDNQRRVNKQEKLNKYMQYSVELGILKI